MPWLMNICRTQTIYILVTRAMAVVGDVLLSVDCAAWTVAYFAIRFVAWMVWGNALLKGYTYRSYIVGIVHEGFVLPVLFGLCVARFWKTGGTFSEWLSRTWDDGDLFWEKQAHFAAAGYLISDATNVFASPAFGGSLAMHHAASMGILVFSLGMPSGSGIGTFNTVVLEWGSLWLNLGTLYPRPLVYTCRLYAYTITRSFAFLANIYLVHLLPWSWNQVLLPCCVALLYNNFTTARTLHKNAAAYAAARKKNK